MSFWIPRKEKDGRWKMYSVNFPLQLVVIIFVVVVTFLVMIFQKLFG